MSVRELVVSARGAEGHCHGLIESIRSANAELEALGKAKRLASETELTALAALEVRLARYREAIDAAIAAGMPEPQ